MPVRGTNCSPDPGRTPLGLVAPVRSRARRLRAALLSRTFAAMLLLSALPLISLAQPSPGVFGPGPGCNLFPAPASIGASVPLSYFGPPPSQSNPSLVGPVQLLKSGQLDEKSGTITLPLYLGYLTSGDQDSPFGRSKNLKKVWYILTDVSDPEVASLL